MPQHRPDSRFAADVEYSGRAGQHDYAVHVRHRLLDTTFTVVIDGIEHDPKAEEKARKGQVESEDEQAETAQESESADDAARDASADDGGAVEGGAANGDSTGGGSADDDSADGDSAGDDLRFTLEEGFSTLRCTVRRPREDGDHKDAEVITIRTAGLGGAGEVEVRNGFDRTVLVPAEGSPSAARDAKRTAHPTRYALIAALVRAAGFLLPLLGLGAFLGGLLDPVKEWVEARVRRAVDAIAEATAPLREWVAELLQPLRDALEWLLRPLRELLVWLLGLLPDFALPFDVTGWVVDVLIPVIVVAVVFAATRRGLKDRRKKLAETRTGRSEPDVRSPDGGETDDGEPDVEEPTLPTMNS